MFSKIMNARVAVIALVLGSSMLTGCASIVSGRYQEISIETRDADKTVEGVGCELHNNKGRYFVTTPATIKVRKAYQDLKIRCEKDKLQPGFASVKSHTKGLAYGNILFGGIIGVAIDTTNGAAFDYPSLISVEMGETSFIPPRPGASKEALNAAFTGAGMAGTAKKVEPEEEICTGISSATVEKLAKGIGCNTAVGARLLSEPGPVEDYEVKCDLGGFVKAKCELRQCQLQ